MPCALTHVKSVAEQVETVISPRKQANLNLQFGEVCIALVVEVDIKGLLKPIHEVQVRTLVLQPQQL